MDILEVKNLKKQFGPPPGGFKAVENISFSLKRGEILGFLGPNGAGKTTTIHMLLGILTPTSGSISYFGKDLNTHKQEILGRINFASSFNTLQGRITVYENLLVFGLLYGVQKIQQKIKELASTLEFEENLNKLYWDISAGQKTRVNLAKALINDPEVLLMDEPTASLDPDISDKLLTYIEELKRKRNISILYTSHEMDEVTRICDRVIIMSNGSIVAHDTPIGLTKRIKKAVLQLTFDAPKKDVEAFLKKHKYDYKFVNDYIVRIKLKEEIDTPKIIFDMGKAKIWITDIEVEKPSLEDVFIQIARS